MSDLRYDAPVIRRRPRFLSIGIGLLLILLAGILGPIPGPGGIVLFAAGLALLLKKQPDLQKAVCPWQTPLAEIRRTLRWRATPKKPPPPGGTAPAVWVVN